MIIFMIAAAAAAAQPTTPTIPADEQQPQHAHQPGKPPSHEGKDCCKDMAKKHEGHSVQ